MGYPEGQKFRGSLEYDMRQLCPTAFAGRLCQSRFHDKLDFNFLFRTNTGKTIREVS